MKNIGKAPGEATRSVRRRKVRAPRPEPDGISGGFYAELLTSEELARLKSSASPEDELKLLRSCVRRLFRGMHADKGGGYDQKKMQTLVQLIRAIVSIERFQAREHNKQDELAESIREAVTGLDPYRQL